MRTLQNSSFPIGIVEEATYDDEVVQFEPRDCLWLYSDGLVEAMNDDGQQFGNERLEAELRADNAVSIKESVDRLLQIVESWTGRTGPQDDISIVALGIDKI